ncbi:MAG TPA: hypothetical protein PKA54_07030 [Chitinophagaceae bacterium]|nr:hypothetical protein [Chitinophagaceae bacterium]
MFKRQNNIENYLTIFGLIAYAVMLILAVYFYKERTILCDTSTQLFEILNKHSFAIQVQRFGAAITQVFPLTASILGLSLKSVLIAYSVSYIIFYGSVFFIILKVFKNINLAIVLLLFNTMMVRYSFYWVQCEFVQGVVFTLLFLAITEYALSQAHTPNWYYPSFVFCIITIIYFYPLLVFVIAFALLYDMILNPQRRKKIGIILVIFLISFYVKNTYFSNWYDATKFESTHGILSKIPHMFYLTSFKQLFLFFKNEYYPSLLFLLGLTTYFIVAKKYIQLLIMWTFFIGVFVLILLTYPDGFVQFYIESQLLILSIFVAIPFAYQVVNSKIKLAIPFAIFLLFTVRVIHVSNDFTNRLHYLRNVLANTSPKVIIPIEKLDMNIMKYTWGLAYEGWLLSTLESGKTQSVVCEETPNQFRNFQNDKMIFLTNTQNKPYQEIKNLYFQKDTTHVYQLK